MVAFVAAVLAGCATGSRTNWLGDERWDHTERPLGTIVVIGDSVGYGLTTQGGFTERLAAEGWGPLRSSTQLGLHAAPESSTDSDTVVRWIAEIRAMGLNPRVVVVISGANDVGYPQGHDVARNVQRIETALNHIGGIPVVWTTISHNRPEWMAAWNQALRDVEARRANLHVCDWAAELALYPHYLEQDRVHMTVGPNGGYAAMSGFITACARAVA